MFKQILIALALCCASGAFAAVDVNQASVAELDGIKGIGPAMSSRRPPRTPLSDRLTCIRRFWTR